jgi:ApaG protein
VTGIEVSVATQFVDSESDFVNRRFFFAYTITITNRGIGAAQLLNRHWIITNGEGEVREVKGPGVVGEQPRITPMRQYSYTSACVLETPVGSMQGAYEFQTDAGQRFLVAIPMFTLSVPNAVH